DCAIFVELRHPASKMASIAAVVAANPEFDFERASATLRGGPFGAQMLAVIGVHGVQECSGQLQALSSHAGIEQRALIPIKRPPLRISHDHAERHRVE